MSHFGSCRRHSQQGLSAPADNIDGLCATCRSHEALAIRRLGTYNGSKPLAEETPPPAALADNTERRMSAREERKQAFAAALKAALDAGKCWPAAVQDARQQVVLAAKTARTYAAELRAADPVFWAEAEVTRP